MAVASMQQALALRQFISDRMSIMLSEQEMAWIAVVSRYWNGKTTNKAVTKAFIRATKRFDDAVIEEPMRLAQEADCTKKNGKAKKLKKKPEAPNIEVNFDLVEKKEEVKDTAMSPLTTKQRQAARVEIIKESVDPGTDGLPKGWKKWGSKKQVKWLMSNPSNWLSSSQEDRIKRQRLLD